MDEEKFDAIVVGAGPAGSAAALALARKGLTTVLIERGEYPGAKNVMGGVLYRRMLEELVPDFQDQAPLERPVVEQRIVLMHATSAVTAGFKDPGFAGPPANAFTVLRAQFDQWFAQKAEEAGAMLLCGMPVEDVVRRDGKVAGVRTFDGSELLADVVIVADGVNSLLAKKLGLRGELQPNEVALAVKQVISLPEKLVNDRFNVTSDQGVVMELMGSATAGMAGQAFLYTNRSSISIGVGCLLSEFVRTGKKPYDILEDLKQHPYVAPLIEGGESEEYMSHMIPEGGYDTMPQVYGDGFLLCGDAAKLVNVLHREGSNLAMESGRLAAETVAFAKERGDFSAKTLKHYRDALEASFVLKDLEQYRRLPHHMEQNPALFDFYPRVLNEAAREIFTVDGTPKRQKERSAVRRILRERPMLRIARDLYGFWRTVR